MMAGKKKIETMNYMVKQRDVRNIWTTLRKV